MGCGPSSFGGGSGLPRPNLEIRLPGAESAPPRAERPAAPPPLVAAAAPPPLPAPPPSAPEPPAARRASATVLVVDDNADYRKIVTMLLRAEALRVIEAVDGQDGIRLAAAKRPDLILMDFNMPRMNGFELLQELRAQDETRKVPVILFTGSPHRRHLRDMNLDVAAFLDKPVANKTLLEHVRRVLAAQPAPAPAQAEPAAVPPPPPPALRAAAPAPASVAPSLSILSIPEPTLVSAPALVLPPLAAAPAFVPAAPPPAAFAPAPAAPAIPAAPPEEEAPAAPAEIPEPGADPLAPEDPFDDPNELGAGDLLETVDAAQEQARLERERGIEAVADDSPLVKRVHQLLVQAIARRASDVHIEPQEDRVVVRYRIDGVLVEVCTLPLSIHPRLTTRIKIMANLVITEHRLPQDGQFRARLRGQKVEFRVSTLPSAYGEKIVLRALASGNLTPNLGALGLSPRDREVVDRTLQSPHGLILVTGPTGSGKTSTLYSMLAALNKPDVNILTAEDPIEYRLAGITQVQVHPAIGFKFETALRAFLRQDPDVMLVGEIRDLETAEIAVKASITGHLVLSTLHTNSAPATVARLAHMGVPAFLIAASARLIIAQRLVRKLCPHCRVPAPLGEGDRRALTAAEQASVSGALRGAGCARCSNSGFLGRMPVFEVMPMQSPEMREALQHSQDVDRIAAVAAREGMTSLRQAALRAVAAGETSLAEAYKVIFSD